MWRPAYVPFVRCVLAAAIPTAGVLLAARADATCAFRTIPERLSSPWEDAAQRSRLVLETGSGDCGEVLLEVEGDIATLTFRTTDGRTAVRVLKDPAELPPALDALRVTLPNRVEPGPEPGSNAVPRAVPPRDDARRSEPSEGNLARETKKEPPSIHALVNALVGGRLAGPGPLLAPSVDLAAGLELPHWELAASARWTPVYAVLTDDATRPAQLASIAAGLAVGPRLSCGKNLVLAFGLTLSAASEHEGWHSVDATTNKQVDHDEDRGQALIGAYVAAVFPVTRRTRFRSLLASDVDATHVGESTAPVSGVPVLPWWALTLALGVESEVL